MSTAAQKPEKSNQAKHRINYEIKASEVRLIGVEGEQVGIVKFGDAMRMAQENEVDLVEIASQSMPIVCRLMDYGKFKYQETKKSQEAKKNRKVIQIKEVKLRPETDDNDYQVKLRALMKFLEEGNKAKVSLRFRGREITHQDRGVKMMERICQDLQELGQVEQAPKLEGRQIVMMIAPKKK